MFFLFHVFFLLFFFLLLLFYSRISLCFLHPKGIQQTNKPIWLTQPQHHHHQLRLPAWLLPPTPPTTPFPVWGPAADPHRPISPTTTHGTSPHPLQRHGLSLSSSGSSRDCVGAASFAGRGGRARCCARGCARPQTHQLHGAAASLQHHFGIASSEPGLLLAREQPPLPDTDEFIKGLKVSLPSLLNALIYASV